MSWPRDVPLNGSHTACLAGLFGQAAGWRSCVPSAYRRGPGAPGEKENREAQGVKDRAGLAAAQTVAGKKLDAQDLWRRLKVGQVVVVTVDHKGLDPVYRQALAANVIIFVAPPPAPQVEPAPGRGKHQ